MKLGAIQDRLTATNRWWADPQDWAKQDPDLIEVAEAPFHYTPKALANLTPGGLYILRGPRRVGKSVELKRAIGRLISEGVDPRLIVHMSVDRWRASDLYRLVQAASQITPGTKKRYWFIDEITGVYGAWPAQIKWLRDNDPRFRTDTVVLTGSSSSKFRESLGDLAGRRGKAVDPDRVLLPMGFPSFLRSTFDGRLPPPIGPLQMATLTPQRLRETTFELAPWLHVLTSAWEIYLRVGGFPKAVSTHCSSLLADSHFHRELLRVISGDAFRTARLSDLQTNALLQRITKGIGSLASMSNIARNIDVAPPTAKERIDDLRESFIVWPAPREKNLQPALRAQPKLYFTDPIYTQLAEAATDLTTLSEQQLGVGLLRNFEKTIPGSYVEFSRVLHHRTKTNAEIDFVGPYFGGVAIESKYVDGGWRRSAGRTLRASRWRGIVATRTELNLEDPDVAAVPTAMIAWLLDT